MRLISDHWAAETVAGRGVVAMPKGVWYSIAWQRYLSSKWLGPWRVVPACTAPHFYLSINHSVDVNSLRPLIEKTLRCSMLRVPLEYKTAKG